MEPNRLSSLPKAQKWDQVVDLIKSGAEVDEIAAATSKAAEKALSHAANDPALVNASWLLSQLPLAARAKDFPGKLRELGLPVGSNPGLMEVVSAFTDAVDIRVREDPGTRTDLGEMAQLAAAETLTAAIGKELPTLFGTTAEDVRGALSKLATAEQFRWFAREFFARLTLRYLAYFLSRDLSNHVGGDGRFAGVDEHTNFNRALEQHCRQASRIIEDYAEKWWSKIEAEGEIAPENAGKFAYRAFEKIRKELRAQGGAHE